MSYEIELYDNLRYRGNPGKLFFTRYNDGNPALLFRFGHGNSEVPLSLNVPEFFDEYPFGAYRLIVINYALKDSVDLLIDTGIISSPVFNIDFENEIVPICELSDQVMDLLNSCGEYYA